MSEHGPVINNEPMSKDDQIFFLAQDIKIALEVAEARGFERGVKEAAALYETGKSEDMEWISFIGVRDAILALLEKDN
jgi:hypothetical protein